MKKKKKEIIVVSLGGSLIVPDHIDIDFLTSFRALILLYVKKGIRFVLICGGGKTARVYQQAASRVGNLRKDEIDWIGIHSTRLNAQLMHAIFLPWVHPYVISDPTKPFRFTNRILIAAGWEPGCSTDYDAVLIAKAVGAKKLANLSNIDCVYTKDPRIYSDARALPELSWKEYRKIIPKKWDPGLNAPFDPVAAKCAEAFGMEVAILNGRDMSTVQKYFDGKACAGTIIK
jgi:uridylate kinase